MNHLELNRMARPGLEHPAPTPARGWNHCFLKAACWMWLGTFGIPPALSADEPFRSGPDDAPTALGAFTSHADIGSPAVKGSAAYDPNTHTYAISGAGRNMWADQDEFHFVWRRITGDFTAHAQAKFVGEGVDPHRKLGWMARRTLEPDSPHVNAVVHGDGLTSLQFRRKAAAETEEIKSSLNKADVIRLERRGDRYILSVARSGQDWVTSHIVDLPLGKELYVGLFVCSHNPEVIERAVFSKVRLNAPKPAGIRAPGHR